MLLLINFSYPVDGILCCSSLVNQHDPRPMNTTDDIQKGFLIHRFYLNGDWKLEN